MKRIIAAAALICIALVFLLEPLGLAWMSDNGMSSPIDITSNVHKAYFESGDGTSDLVYDEDGNIVQSATGPYEIKYPLQLYYFAWLQYLGYFNMPKLDENGNEMKDENGNVITNTVYFYLSADLDMDTIGDENVPEDEQYKYVLPPVGTLTNPFLGNFDGQGHTIKDLTVENVKDNLTERPNNTDKFGDAKEVEIVGFFGVIGELAKGDYSYATEANEVKNLVLEKLTVTTLTNNALIGLVAGYVNGIVDCVGVVGSTVNIKSGTLNLKDDQGEDAYTKNLSDYSLIGYCTEKFKDSVYIMDVMLNNPGISDKYNVIPGMSDEGNSQGWGGSIAMQEIFSWLSYVKTHGATGNSGFVTERTDVVMPDGSRYTVGEPKTDSMNTTILEYNELDKETGETVVRKFGSFVFDDGTGAGDNYNFMGGATSVKEYKYEYTEKEVPLYYITDGEGNYLSFNGTSIINSNEANATKWYVSNDTNGVISTVVGSTIYFLTVTNGTIGTISSIDADPSNLPSWSVSGNTYAFNGIRILYDNGTWTVANEFKIHSGNNYLDKNNNNNGVENDNETNAVTWNITPVDGGYNVTTVVGTTTYYLGYTYTASNYGWGGLNNVGLTFSNNPSSVANNHTVWQFNGTQLYWQATTTQMWGGTTTHTYYLRYSSGWNLSTNVANLAFESTTNANVDINSSGTTAKKIVCNEKTYVDNALKNHSNDEAGITYFPLSALIDEDTNEPYSISPTNKGYIISTNWGATENGEHDALGNVRISRYALSNLSNYVAPYTITYLTNKTDTRFVSIDSAPSESHLQNLGLQKYASCYEKFRSSLTETQSCYGIHFMTASVTESNIAEIDAYLNGTWKEDYEVPTNCIDFTLHEQGFINFFAGNYYNVSGYTPNDACFSLYEIIRNGDESIKSVLEINKVYARVNMIDAKKDEYTMITNAPYIYTYTEYDKNDDGTLTKREVGLDNVPKDDPENGIYYRMVFDCAWITDTAKEFGNSTAWQKYNLVFYFEVPVNDGEYAIGSTAGKTGAYLIYLDLAANAQLIEREKQYEMITETQSGATVPNGVELLEKAEGYDKDGDGNVDVNPSGSSFVSINDGASGSILFEKTDKNTITHTANDKTSAEYIGAGNTLINGKDPEEMPQSVQKVTIIERTTYRDYNLVTEDYVVTIITKTTVTNEDGTSEVKYTKQVTTTDSSGNLVADKTYPAKEVPEKEAVPDTEDDVELEAVANLLNFGFAYGQEFDLTLSYEYIPAGVDENGSATAPTYRITVNNPGDEDVIIKAILTDAGEDSDITFVIVDGNGNAIATLDKTADDIQSITVKGTKASTEGGTEGSEGTDTPENGEGTEGGENTEDPAA